MLGQPDRETWFSIAMDFSRDPMGVKGPKGPYRKPRRVAPPDGQQEKQILMGMAYGMHLVQQTYIKVKFILKTKLEAQILFMLMAPFLVVPLCCLAIPAICVMVPAMCMGAISQFAPKFGAVQHVVERESFKFMENKFRQSVRRSNSMPHRVSQSGNKFPSLQRLATRDLLGSTGVNASFRGDTDNVVVSRHSVKSFGISSRRVRSKAAPPRSNTFSFGGGGGAKSIGFSLPGRSRSQRL